MTITMSQNLFTGGNPEPETVGLIVATSTLPSSTALISSSQHFPSNFVLTHSTTASSVLDITRATAEFSRECSLVFVVLLGHSTQEFKEDSVIERQELVLGAIADAFGQDLWSTRDSSMTHCPCRAEFQFECQQQQHDTNNKATTTDTLAVNNSSFSKQLYAGRIPCKSEIHYIQIPGISLLQPVVSVHNVHTLIQPLQSCAELPDYLASVLNVLYTSRPSFVSAIDGFQVMKDVYRLVSLADEQDKRQPHEHSSIEGQMSTTVTPTQDTFAISPSLSSESELMRERDYQCWKSVRHAVQVIEEALRLYGPQSISLSFNGGKDCTVILHLYIAVLYKVQGAQMSQSPVQSSLPDASTRIQLHSPIPSIYVTHKNPFGQVERFVDDEVERYNLDLVRIAGPMKRALEEYHELKGEIEAIMVGTRRDDPHGGPLKAFTPTDPSWPPFMRIHPILDWTYHDIWTFLRAINIPYCGLYDLGYTSLGGRDDTFPNPQLKRLSIGPFFDIPAAQRTHAHAVRKIDTHEFDNHSQGDDCKKSQILDQLCQVGKELDQLEEAFLFGPAWKLVEGESERCGRAK